MEDLVNIVCTDNYARETVADKMWKEDVPRSLAVQLIEVLNEHYKNGDAWFVIFEKGQRLSRGMEDLV